MALKSGSVVQARCGACRADTRHVVVKAARGVPSRVRCRSCGREHVYKPRSAAAAVSRLRPPAPKAKPATKPVGKPGGKPMTKAEAGRETVGGRRCQGEVGRATDCRRQEAGCGARGATGRQGVRLRPTCASPGSGTRTLAVREGAQGGREPASRGVSHLRSLSGASATAARRVRSRCRDQGAAIERLRGHVRGRPPQIGDGARGAEAGAWGEGPQGGRAGPVKPAPTKPAPPKSAPAKSGSTRPPAAKSVPPRPVPVPARAAARPAAAAKAPAKSRRS